MLWSLWKPQGKLLYKVKHKVLLNFLRSFLTADKWLKFPFSFPWCAFSWKGWLSRGWNIKETATPLLRNSTECGWGVVGRIQGKEIKPNLNSDPKLCYNNNACSFDKEPHFVPEYMIGALKQRQHYKTTKKIWRCGLEWRTHKTLT